VTNSVRYADGKGTLSIWREKGRMLFEVRDRGFLEDRLVGRRRPSPRWTRGRGLWLANQFCDLVQIRSAREGNVVRLHMSLN
jgi:anti-sigma regulatory factor (Ser/Thr protein kinase)